MSQIIRGQTIDFVIHLMKSPDINPYQATADYLAAFLQPRALPSWSPYVQRVVAAAFLVLFLQSAYILYVRSKTKKVYHIGFNARLVQLDRANHCGLCYLLYSILAMTEIVWGEIAQSGHLDSGGPNFILGINFTFTIACASVILWLCICHYALVKQRTVSRRMTPVGKLIPTTVTWALNILLGMIVFVSNVSIFISFLLLNLEYRRITQLLSPVIEILRKSASTCALSTCSVNEVVLQILPLTPAYHHIDLVVKYNQLGLDFYIFFCGVLILLYVPFLFLLSKIFTNQTELDHSIRRQQKEVFANTLLEFTIILSILVLDVCARSLIRKGAFMFDPNFWLIVRIGPNVTVAILGNIALFLILYNLRGTTVTPSNPPISFSKLTTGIGSHKSDVDPLP